MEVTLKSLFNLIYISNFFLFFKSLVKKAFEQLLLLGALDDQTGSLTNLGSQMDCKYSNDHTFQHQKVTVGKLSPNKCKFVPSV